MTIGDIKLTPLKTSTEKIEFFKEAKNNTFNSIMESLTKKPSDEDDDWRKLVIRRDPRSGRIPYDQPSAQEWDRLVKRVDDSTGLVDRGDPQSGENLSTLCTPREAHSNACTSLLPWVDTLGKTGTDGFAALAKDIEKDSNNVPYGGLIKNGVIEYNGVTLVPDYETNSICLGDCGQQAVNDGKVISVPLENGGYFKFNVDNMSDISGIIGMFTAEDAGRIMNAIEQYKFTQSKLNEMEDETFKTVTGNHSME